MTVHHITYVENVNLMTVFLKDINGSTIGALHFWSDAECYYRM